MTLINNAADNVWKSLKQGGTAAGVHAAIELGTPYLGHFIQLGNVVSTGALAFGVSVVHRVAKDALGSLPDAVGNHLKHPFVAAVLDAALLFGLSYAATLTLAPMVGVAVGVNVVGLWAVTMASRPIADKLPIPSPFKKATA